MRINNIPVTVTKLSGNLRVITILETKDKELKNRQTNLYTILRTKCGAAKPGVLSPEEQENIPTGLSLVVTDDAYTHLVPYYCDINWSHK